MRTSTGSTSGVPEHVDKMLDKLIQTPHISTPALIYDVEKVQERLGLLQMLRQQQKLKLLYSIKSASFSALLEHMLPYVDGFSVSSLNEARYIANQYADSHSVHMTSPGILQSQVSELGTYCNAISVNSLTQWQRFQKSESLSCSLGIRINPHTQFNLDTRYDPCRKHSKLGISSHEFITACSAAPETFASLEGIHVHNNCQSHLPQEMNQTLHAIKTLLESVPIAPRWLNLGGGYIVADESAASQLNQILDTADFLSDVQILMEPGKGIVGDAGVLLAEITDIFTSDGMEIAIVDTTVNHLPEVFEYQYQPDIANEQCADGVQYRLAGMSCLSGDIFGDYRLTEKPAIGDRIVFKDVGAYMHVKANMFNGIPLPTVYLMHPNGELECIKESRFEDYLRQLC